MAYASVVEVQARMARTMTAGEQVICAALLDDAAVLIDVYKQDASADAKKVVSCRMVMRAMGDGQDTVPMGATQGSMSGLGYSQSWTIGSGGATGEIYLSRTDKMLLGGGNSIGSYSPIEELVCVEQQSHFTS